MATREIPSSSAAVLTPQQVTPPSKWRPIHYWSAVGLFFAVLQVYLWVSWLATDAFPRHTGADPVPTHVKALAWVLQAVCVLAAITVVVYIWRRTRREGQLAWDALIAIAFAGVFWQDTLCNYQRPIFFYNSYLVNLGAVDPHIPGWLSPNGGNIPEPFLLSGPLYAWWFVLFGIVFCAMARKLRQLRPNISKVGIFLVGVVALGLLDMVLENTFIYAQLFAYPGVINALTFNAGTIYQFPGYEALIVGVFCSIVGMIRLNRDDRGHSVIERGVDELHVGTKAKTTLRILAFLGLSNFMFVVLGLLYIWIGCYIDPMPHYPSYLTNDLCGTAVSPPCPGPGVPIHMSNTPHRTANP